MPTILHLTLLITDLHLGGTPLLLRDLALTLSQSSVLSPQHFQLSIISLKPLPLPDSAFRIPHSAFPTIPQQLRAANIPVHSLNMTGMLSLPRALRQLTHLLEQQKPDLLYSMLIHADLLATLAHRRLQRKQMHTPKLIHSIHTLQPNPRWHWSLQGKLSKHADAMIVPAQPILDKLSAHGPLPQHTIVIPNGIDIDRFANARPIPPNELPWSADAPVIGYIGRFDPVKNLPLLLSAFALLHSPNNAAPRTGSMPPRPGSPPQHPANLSPNPPQNTSIAPSARSVQTSPESVQPRATSVKPHLALVGYGPQEAELKALAASLGSGDLAPFIHFLGPTTTPERWYKSFTLHCLPSEVEGFGLTLLESLAAGTPVVALDTSVTRPLRAPFPEATLLPTPATPESLTLALQKVIAKYHLPPLGPTEAPFATLSHLRSTHSTARMAELHKIFLKNLLDSAD